MKRNAMKWTVLGGALAVIILYGIDVSSRGIERIYGPIEGAGEYTELQGPQQTEKPDDGFETEQQRKIAKLEKELEQLKKMAEGEIADDASSYEDEGIYDQSERLPGLPTENDQPAVNRIADSTSGLLQNMSSEGIRMVVSIFDGLTK
ncbi:hypothetical protein AB4Z29_06445 [Paenibacillus sp. 2TAB23]|uniref:hypothetical protein n=1 Tax=Paenibacillus sp. 2TAB23 TaxID=3233004 RepID=UPI003F9472FF